MITHSHRSIIIEKYQGIPLWDVFLFCVKERMIHLNHPNHLYKLGVMPLNKEHDMYGQILIFHLPYPTYLQLENWNSFVRFRFSSGIFPSNQYNTLTELKILHAHLEH